MKKFIVLLAFIAFWFEGNTLYWTDGSQDLISIKSEAKTHWLQFQLNNKMPADINKEPIERIEVLNDRVYISTKDKAWTLYYSNDVEGRDWYVKGPYGPDGKL